MGLNWEYLSDGSVYIFGTYVGLSWESNGTALGLGREWGGRGGYEGLKVWGQQKSHKKIVLFCWISEVVWVNKGGPGGGFLYDFLKEKFSGVGKKMRFKEIKICMILENFFVIFFKVFRAFFGNIFLVKV